MGDINKGVANTLKPAQKNTKKDQWRSNDCEKIIEEKKNKWTEKVECITYFYKQTTLFNVL